MRKKERKKMSKKERKKMREKERKKIRKKDKNEKGDARKQKTFKEIEMKEEK